MNTLEVNILIIASIMIVGDHYKVIQTLGDGGCAKVLQAIDTRNDEICALKIMKLDGSQNDREIRSMFKNEVTVLHKLNHQNIIKILNFSKGISVLEQNLNRYNACCIVLEYAPNGDMFKYLSKLGRLEEPIARYYFHQLISIIEYMHTCGYSHRDLKVENCLLDKEFNLKLADFGFSSKSKTSWCHKGTKSYMAPEIYDNNGYKTEIADIFSAGVILFIMCTSFTPFMKANKYDMYYSKIMQGNLDELWDVYSKMDNFDYHFSSSFKDFVSKILESNPRKRITLQDIKSHEWFNEKVASPIEVYEEMLKRKNRITCSESSEHHSTDDDSQKDSEISVKSENSSQFACFSLICDKSTQIKLSKFYNAKDGDDLLRTIEDYAKVNNYIYIKSSKEFKLDMIIKTENEITNLSSNILINQENNMRCVQFIKCCGSTSTFNKVYSEISFILDTCYGVTGTELFTDNIRVKFRASHFFEEEDSFNKYL